MQEREQVAVRQQRRWVPAALAVVFTPLMVLAVSACSQDVSGTATTVVPVGATDFATIPPVITTAPGVSTTLPPGSVGYEQEYVVASGDSPIKVANSYGISVEELLMYNGWVSTSQFPYPTQTLKIPPTAKTTTAQAIANTTLPPQGPSSQGCGTRPAGTYEVAPGENWLTVLREDGGHHDREWLVHAGRCQTLRRPKHHHSRLGRINLSSINRAMPKSAMATMPSSHQ